MGAAYNATVADSDQAMTTQCTTLLQHSDRCRMVEVLLGRAPVPVEHNRVLALSWQPVFLSIEVRLTNRMCQRQVKLEQHIRLMRT